MNICSRHVSDSETNVRKMLPIKKDRDMLKVFGDRNSFSGVIAYLKTEFDPTKTKHHYKMLRASLFEHSYIANRVLSTSARGGSMVSILHLDPN